MVNLTDQNSYITSAAAADYFNERLYSNAWTEASEDDKARALINATKKIDRLQFCGLKLVQDQPLQFPRKYPPSSINPLMDRNTFSPGSRYNYTVWYEETVIPAAVKAATCEEALALLAWGNNSRIQLQAQGVKSASVGKISETYGGLNKLLSPEALELLKPYTALTGAII